MRWLLVVLVSMLPCVSLHAGACAASFDQAGLLPCATDASPDDNGSDESCCARHCVCEMKQAPVPTAPPAMIAPVVLIDWTLAGVPVSAVESCLAPAAAPLPRPADSTAPGRAGLPALAMLCLWTT